MHSYEIDAGDNNSHSLTASKSPSDVGGTKWSGVKASSFSWRTYIITRSHGGGVNFRRFNAGEEYRVATLPGAAIAGGPIRLACGSKNSFLKLEKSELELGKHITDHWV